MENTVPCNGTVSVSRELTAEKLPDELPAVITLLTCIREILL